MQCRKNGKIGLHGGENAKNCLVFSFRASVSFYSTSASAKNFNFGASLRNTGIQVYSLGINTYSSDQIVAVASISTLQ